MDFAADIIMYGRWTCSDCRRVKRVFARRKIKFIFVDTEDNEAAKDEMALRNGGIRRVPTIFFPDGGPPLIEPTNKELNARLNKLQEESP